MVDTQLQTEFEFTLPQGYSDGDGNLHREGRMRLATAADEIEPLQDPRVQSNSSYLTIVLLARVVTELGDVESVTTDVIENLFVADLEYLQALYERINNQGENAVDTACPDCGEQFSVSAETGAVVQSDAGGPAGDAPEGAGGQAAPADATPGEMETPPGVEGGPDGDSGK